MPVNFRKEIEIRDSRNGSWFWIQTHVWRDRRLKKADKVVYGTLASFASRSQELFPSIHLIAKYSDVSERQTYYSIKQLEKFGYIGIKRQIGKKNVYVLLKTTPAIIAPLHQVQETPAKTTLLTISNNKKLNNNATLGENKTGMATIGAVIKGIKIPERKKGGATYAWQDQAVEMWKKLGLGDRPSKSWFRTFKITPVGRLAAALSFVVDAGARDPERLFYWKLCQLSKKK